MFPALVSWAPGIDAPCGFCVNRQRVAGSRGQKAYFAAGPAPCSMTRPVSAKLNSEAAVKAERL
jgi:hypothetical protein